MFRMLEDSTVHALAATIIIAVGILAFIGLDYIFDSGLEDCVTNKSKTNSVKFYECATYSKSQHNYRTGLSQIVLVIMFLVYDIDLLLISSEVLVLFGFGIFEWFIFLLFLLFLILGLMFDSRKIGFSWYLF